MDRRDLLKSAAGFIFSGAVLGKVEAVELGSLSMEEQEEVEEMVDDLEEEELELTS